MGFNWHPWSSVSDGSSTSMVSCVAPRQKNTGNGRLQDSIVAQTANQQTVRVGLHALTVRPGQFGRKRMRLRCLFLVVTLTCTSAFALDDPFAGTWVYNAQKSPKPIIRYTIKDLGGGRYSLTGSTGTTVEIRANGISIKTPAGATVSFKKLDDHDWEMFRDDGQKMVRIYNISPDDRTLTLHDVFTGSPEDNYETTTRYERLSPGKGIFGEWQSVSMEEKMHGRALQMIITPYETDGLSFSIPAHKHLSRMKFDGKLYADSGTGDRKGDSSSGRRLSDSVLEIDDQVNGRLEDRGEFTVSNGGRTLTIVSRPANSTAMFTEVWDKQ